MWYAFQVLIETPESTLTEKAFSELDERIAIAVDADAPLASRDGALYVDVYRSATSLLNAVESTLGELATLSGVTVLRVTPDPLVTATEIGERLGVTRQAVQAWIAGKRGQGGFPAPVVGLGSRVRLWRWVAVLAWLGDRPDELAAARVIERVNHEIEGRRLAG